MRVKVSDIPNLINKEVILNGRFDLGMDPDLRRIIGKTCILIKQCKSGLIQISHEGKLHSVPLANLDTKQNSEQRNDMTQDVITNKNTKVLLTTNFGNILLEVNEAAAPETVKNFLQYVNDKFYDGTIFHRVIDGFMIQGGGYNSITNEKHEVKETRQGIQNEGKNGLKNEPYSIAMARTAAPHSATAQFFINVKNNSFLDHPGQDGWGYCVFGKVIEGKETVDRIKVVKTERRGMFADVPVDDVVIQKAEVVE